VNRYTDDIDWLIIAKDRERSGLSMSDYLQSGRMQAFMPPGIPLPSFKTFSRLERRARTQAGIQTAATDGVIPVYSFTEQQVQSVLEVHTNDTPKRTRTAGGRHQVRVRLPQDIAVEIDCDNPELLLLKTLLLVLP